MAALADNYLDMLKRELQEHYVPHLPPLLAQNGAPAQQQAEKQVARAFSAFVLNRSLNVAPNTAAQSVVDDFNDNGIDAIFYAQKTETLYLLQSKLRSSEQFGQDEALAFCAGVRLLLKQDLSTFNANVLARQTEIESAYTSCSHIKLLIAYAGAGISQHAVTAIEQLIDDPDLDEERLARPIDYFTPPEITDALLQQQAYKPVNTEIELAHSGKLEEPCTTYYGVVKVANLVALHQGHGKALYEKNIRYFLGTQNSDVNRDIQQTLAKDPGSFFYLNNGVTALCTGIDAKGKNKTGARRLKVLGFSIINGAQTVAAAAELMQQTTPPDISAAKVMLTLISAKAEGTFGPTITRARNHQNPVSTANFASLDPQQERLRQELEYYKIKYQYRPEATAIAGSQSILLQEAITALSWLEPDSRYAVWLKAAPASINDANSATYQALFHKNLTGIALANAVFYARCIQKLLRAAEWSSTGLERLTYRHGTNAIGWVFAKRLRNRIRLVQLVTLDEAMAVISQPFDELRQQSYDTFRAIYFDKGPLGFFRNQTYTVPYLAALVERNYGLAQHSALPALKQATGNEAFPRERLFTFMCGQAPQI